MSIGNSRYTEFNGSKDVIPKSRYGITANPLASSFKVGAYEYSGTLGNTYLGGKSLSLSTAFKKAVLCHVSNSKQNCKQEISIKINKGLKLYFEVSFDKEFSSLFADNEKSNLKSFIKKVDKFKSSEFCLILKGSPWAVGRNSVRGDYGIITSSNSILEKLDQSHIHSFAKENLAPIILGSAVANYGSFDEYYEKAITKKLKSLNCKKIEYIDYLVPF
jgi:hypothetical protein